MTTSGKASLPEVLDRAVEGRLARVRVMLPAVVSTYDNSTQRAEVTVLVQDLHRNSDGEIVAETITLTDVPVEFPGFGKNRITFPLRKGTRVMVGFSSSAIARLKAGAKGVVNPSDMRRHDLADGIIFAGFETDPPTSARTDAVEIHSEGEIICGGDEPCVKRSEFLRHGHPIIAQAATSPCAGPVVGAAPQGLSTTFPGTGKLRG